MAIAAALHLYQKLIDSYYQSYPILKKDQVSNNPKEKPNQKSNISQLHFLLSLKADKVR